MTHECGRGGKGGGGGGTEIPNRKTTHRHKQSKNQRLGPQAIIIEEKSNGCERPK